MQDFDVGSRLKQVRLAAGLSQRMLAERAGVPHGQISLIETNRNSPSVSSLRKILGGVPMALAEFFEPERAVVDRVFFRADELTDLTSLIGGHGAASRPKIVLQQVGDARVHNLQVMHERYEPGADTGATLLEHPAHEGGVVVSGSIEVTVGTSRAILHSGDAYLFDSRVPHRFRNVSGDEAVLVSACTPPYL